MATPAAIGRHRVWRDGDVIGMHFEGALTRAEVETMRAAMVEVLAESGTCFLLSDMHACSAIEPEARKYMAEWSREGTDRLTGTAVFGLSFPMRTLVTLVMSAIRFIKNQPVDIAFVKDRGEGLRWIEGRRAEVAASRG